MAERQSGQGGLTAGGLARLHAAAEQHVGDERVPGLVALVAQGDQVHVEALGKLARGGASVDARANAARALGVLRGRAAPPICGRDPR